MDEKFQTRFTLNMHNKFIFVGDSSRYPSCGRSEIVNGNDRMRGAIILRL